MLGFTFDMHLAATGQEKFWIIRSTGEFWHRLDSGLMMVPCSTDNLVKQAEVLRARVSAVL